MRNLVIASAIVLYVGAVAAQTDNKATSPSPANKMQSSTKDNAATDSKKSDSGKKTKKKKKKSDSAPK
jgi:hypothetical protein